MRTATVKSTGQKVSVKKKRFATKKGQQVWTLTANPKQEYIESELIFIK